MFSIHGDLNKKYRFGDKLQSRELTLGLRKTTIIVRNYLYSTTCSSRKSTVQISKFFRDVMHDYSNIIFQVIFLIDEDFNNSRKSKTTILELSCKAVN